MRAREILQEDYNDNLQADLNNLLVGAKGNGATQLKTQDLVSQLYGMGYSVDVNSILTLLSQNPLVTDATTMMITMAPPEGQEGMGTQQDNADQVSDMAQKATKIG
jgi:hypothetical protein